MFGLGLSYHAVQLRLEEILGATLMRDMVFSSRISDRNK